MDNDLITISIPQSAFPLRMEVYDYMARRFPDMRYRLMVDDRIEIQNADERDEIEITAMLEEIIKEEGR